MAPLDVLLIACGLGLACLSLWDQFWTILGEGGGPVTRRVAKATWSVAQRVYRAWPRSRVLSVGGAATVLATVVFWVLMQWTAWTLVFSGIQDGVVNAASGEPADVWERAYFAGYTLSTLGIGDVQPRGGLARVLTAAVSFNGLVQISFAVGYLVPVVVSATDKRRVSILVSCLGTSSADLIVNMWDGQTLDALRPHLERLTPELALLEQRYLSYPVLPYLHSHKRAEAIAPSLAVLDEALTIVRCGLDDDACGLLPSGTQHALQRALSTLIETLATAADADGDEVPPVPSLEPLRRAGLPTVDDATFAGRIAELDARRRTLLGLVCADGWDWTVVATADEPDAGESRLASLYDTEAV